MTEAAEKTILDEYIMKYPTDQNAVDIFSGEWSSKIPVGGLESGFADLFMDGRMSLIQDSVGGFKDKKIFELGPLEGAHSYFMDRAGAKSILAVEANTRAYLKCLITKEILGIPSVNFKLGDFDIYLESSKEKYDFILACGVIYHCINPLKTLIDICSKTNEVGIWTQYYDEEPVRKIYEDRFNYEPVELEYKGFKAKAYTHTYGIALGQLGYCAGGHSVTRWMPEDEWERIFDELGFDFKILAGSKDHQNGPEFTASAVRR